jgi:hypothetical protein
MKDMFYNYEHNINKKEYHQPIGITVPSYILTGNPNISIITNIKGDEIGVQVNKNVPFSLYFYLHSENCRESIAEDLKDSEITFEILNYTHDIVITKTLSLDECFDQNTNTIKIEVIQEELAKLKREAYRVRLAANWADGCYELYPEMTGLLIVR